MRTIRTTFRPEEDLEVDETEFLSLRHQGLILPGWDATEPPRAADPFSTPAANDQDKAGR